MRITYRAFHERCRRLASALKALGIGKNDTVSVMLANTPAMLDCHFGVAMTGAVLNTLNTRLDAATIGFSLDHAEAKVLIVDKEHSPRGARSAGPRQRYPIVIDYVDSEFEVEGERIGTLDYDEMLAAASPDFQWAHPADEWDSISLNYTSGTTGNPQGRRLFASRCGADVLLELPLPLACSAIRSISGRCRCSIATAVLPLDGCRHGRHACLPALGARRRDLRGAGRA